MTRFITLAVVGVFVSPLCGSAQSPAAPFEAAGHVAAVYSGRYDTDVGIGGSRRPLPKGGPPFVPFPLPPY